MRKSVTISAPARQRLGLPGSTAIHRAPKLTCREEDCQAREKKPKNTTNEEFQTAVNNRPFSLQTPGGPRLVPLFRRVPASTLLQSLPHSEKVRFIPCLGCIGSSLADTRDPHRSIMQLLAMAIGLVRHVSDAVASIVQVDHVTKAGARRDDPLAGLDGYFYGDVKRKDWVAGKELEKQDKETGWEMVEAQAF